MPLNHRPAVFVSSTCYDLGHLRSDLKRFVESQGYDPMLSEYNSFPVDPSATTIENCQANVRERADIFVLIVGGRYGSITPSGKSITNVEFLQARAKGIPVYAFVQRQILEILPVWKDNPDGNFSQVDSPKLFGFVDSFRSSGDVWVHPFDNPQDIIDTLRSQWAFLFFDALKLWTKTRDSGIPPSLRNLSGRALRLIIEHPTGWEYILFSTVVADGIRSCEHLRRDLEHGIIIGKQLRMKVQDGLEWVSAKHTELQKTIPSITKVLNEVARDAFGPPGVPGNAEQICYAADRFVCLYRSIIEWALEFQRLDIYHEFNRFIELQARLVNNVVSEIEAFSQRLEQELPDVLNRAAAGENVEFTLILELTVPEGINDEIEAELERLYLNVHKWGEEL